MRTFRAEAPQSGQLPDQALDTHMPADELKLGRIRARRHEAIDQLVPAMMLANIACVVPLTLLLWRAQPVVMLSWCAIIIALCTARLITAIRTNKQSP